MSDIQHPRPAADRNLLFGILAFQMDFISRDALIRAMNVWVLEKGKSLAQILQEQEALSASRRALLEPLVEEHIKQHGDPEKSLAAVGSTGSVLANLQQTTVIDLPEASTGQRFRILRPHARGGLGEVFVAQDEELHREVALKQIQDRHADDPQSRARFLLEAEVTGGLEHPGIVPVYGLGRYPDGRPFYAMRFVKGDNLKDAIERFHRPDAHRSDSGEHGLEFRQLLGRFIDVCNAVAYAHSRGVLHRDLKPGNVMLGPYGETLVVDWGLAKVVGRPESSAVSEEKTLRPEGAGGSTPTREGAAMGTPQYMSPEQATGKLEELGPATDIYSLGATLYCLLTGKAPFTGEEKATVLEQVRRGELAPPRRVKASVPRALEAICLKAMALKPGDRYSSARALADDVEHWLADEPVGAWVEPRAVTFRRWLGRHRTLVTATTAGALVAVLLLAAATALLATANRQTEQARREANAKAVEAADQAARAEANEQRVREEKQVSDRRLYIADMRLAQRAWEEDKIDRLVELLNGQSPEKTDGTDWRGFEWHYWWRVSHSELLTITGHKASVTAVAFSPDGKRLASASIDGKVIVSDAQTGRVVFFLRGHAAPVSCVTFSPDGTLLASAGGGRSDRKGNLQPAEVKVWDAQAGQELRTIKGLFGVVRTVAFSPDSRRLASAIIGDDSGRSLDAGVKVWDPRTGRQILFIQGDVSGVWAIAYSPDGTRLAGGYSSNVWIWDAITGNEKLRLKAHNSSIPSIAFSQDGLRLATASHFDRVVKVWDSVTGKAVRTFENAGPFVALSRDGKQLASSRNGQVIQIWDAIGGKEVLTLKGHTGDVTCAAFSPDNKTLASGSADGSVKVWNPHCEQDCCRIPVPDFSASSVAFSPDGTLLGTASSRVGVGQKGTVVWGKAKISAVGSLRELRDLPGHSHLVFSPDRKRLAAPGTANTVKVWDASTFQEQSTLRGHLGPVSSVAFTPDGKYLASASYDRSIKIWDLATGKKLHTLRGHTWKITGVTFSADGNRLASVSMDGTVRIWDWGSGKEVLVLGNRSQFDLLVSTPCSVAFRSGGQELAAVSWDDTVRVWDPLTGKELPPFRGHTSMVTGLAFSRDGKRLATTSFDKTVKVWDVDTRQEVLTLKGHKAATISAMFSPDGQRLASVSKDGDLIVWDTGPPSPAYLLHRKAVSLVEGEFDRLVKKADVLARLRADAGLEEPLRQQALAYAERYSQDATALNQASWEVVSRRGAQPDVYRRALRQAEESCRLSPGYGACLNTLGVAQYRVGQYQKAVESLKQSETLNARQTDLRLLGASAIGLGASAETRLLAAGVTVHGPVALRFLGSDPVDLSFLAMAHHQLGHKEEARAILARLRETLKQPKWASNQEYGEFLTEAEVVIEGRRRENP